MDMPMHRSCFSLICSPVVMVFSVCLVFIFSGVPKGFCETDLNPLPSDLEPVLSYLFSWQKAPEADFDLEKAKTLISFLTQNSQKGYAPEKRDSARGAFFSFDLNLPLEKVLNYAYNAEIPSNTVMPSSVRLCFWKNRDKMGALFEKMIQSLPDPGSPISGSGIEHIENTPDPSTGAYYSYDMEKRIVLFSCSAGTALISVGQQMDQSDVGKKGWIIGPDEDWNYLYTEEDGLNRAGLKWVDTYMYGSASIILFFQDKADPSRLRCGVFSWVEAGWAGINVVKSSHVYAGLERFAKGFQFVMENSRLPEPDRLAKALRAIGELEQNQLDEKVMACLNDMARRGNISDGELRESIDRKGFADAIGPRQKQARLMLEFMKGELGLPAFKWGVLASGPGQTAVFQ